MRPPDRARAAAPGEPEAGERVSLASNKANGSTPAMSLHPQPAAAESDVHLMFDSLDGRRIAGGCGRCDAFIEVRTDDDGVHVVTVNHDEWCPDFARRQRRTQQ